ncbi:SusC/RagA family TonB-linked outer membrane protein [Portibacter marinus]|uniref:SusC/RagA family TonB-linked outer membrane protein n=1 Tax=Portibacter marinus TaxID=2898660 RepID=UPI001F306F4C|nr:TonB-dependent receptor [Portibacter marinus]
MEKTLSKAKYVFVFAFLLIGQLVVAQNRTVSGQITDADGLGLPGVSIIEVGTNNGTITDIDGNYSISVEDGASLQYSYIGYATETVLVGDQSTIDVVMVGDAKVLDEVVVTGYSSQSKKNITGAVSSVEVEEITDLPVNSAEQALQGRAAGVNVTSSGQPGSGTSVRIRGYGTIGNNEPLYIIDGVPSKRGIGDINPNDIKSIQVLKDASAASIYGARAGNGVVIVTTKNGSVDGKSKITVDLNYGLQSVSNLPELMNPQQLADYIWELQKNAGLTPSHGQYGNGATPVIPDFINGDPNQPYDRLSNAITPAAKGEGTDYFDEVFRTSPITNANISASGGNQSGQYGISLGYLNQQGTVIHTNYERWNLRANTLFRIRDNIRVGENFNLTYGDRVGLPGGVNGSGNAISNAFRSPSIIPIYDVENNFAGSKGGELTNAANPVAVLFRSKDNNTTNLRALGGAFIEVDFIEGLTAKSSLNINFDNWENKSFAFPNPEDIEGNPTGTRLSVDQGRSEEWTWYNTLNYDKSFGIHNLNVLVGTEAINSKYDQFGASRSTFFSTDIDYWQLNAGEEGIGNYGFGSERALFSVFGRVNYNFAGRYLLGATVRRDGSSRFGPSNRYAVFPAFNVGWRISDEPFLRNNSYIADLKLRAGWGQTGNDEIGDYRYSPAFATSLASSAYAIGGSNSSVISGFHQTVSANPNVKWETTTSLNVGLDATLTNGFSMSLDWYDRLTTDLLIQKPLPSTAGITAFPFENVGSVRNTGVDLALNYDKAINTDMSFNASIVFGTYRNEVTDLGGENVNILGGQVRESQTAITQEGLPLAAFYGLQTDGIFQNQAEVDAHAEQPGAGVGRVRYVDQNDDGVITLDGDRVVIGNPHPDFTYGINLGFNYKKFSVTLFANGVQGNDLYNANKYFTHFNSFQGNRSTDLLNSFGYPGVTNPDPELPLVSLEAPALEYGSTSFFIEDGSYFRIKNLQLGYTIDDSLIGSLDDGSIRVFVQGTNLLTFTEYTGLDPEVGIANFYNGGGDLSIGLDSGFYPVNRTFTVGFSATF